jgi:hypothetical protein
MNDYEADIRILPDRVPSLSQATFRRRLAALLDEFLVVGGDPWWMNQELNLAGMQAIDSLRCDLVDYDEGGDAA